jgi:hypothetical protein
MLVTIAMRCLGLAMAVLGVALTSEGRAKAGYIPIANASFEEPTYPTYGFGPAAGWTESGSGSGAFRPLIGVETNYVPDGLQAGFAGSLAPGSLYQDIGVGVTDGASYQLDLFVGSRLEGYAANYLVQLFAGTTIIGSASGTIATGTGNFFAVQINASGVGSGDLAIQLSETGNGQSLFDDLSLQINPSSVPEPSSLTLTGLAGLIAMAFCRKGKEKQLP